MQLSILSPRGQKLSQQSGTGRCGGGRYGGAFQFRVDATAEPPEYQILALPWTLRRVGVRVRVLRVKVMVRVWLRLRVRVRLGLGFRRSGHDNL